MKSFCCVVFQLFLALTICYAQTTEKPEVEICAKKFPTVDYKIYLEEKPVENPTRDAKCFLYCVYQQRGLMTENKYNIDEMIDVVRKSAWKNMSEVEETVHKCSQKSAAEDACEAAYVFFECSKAAYHKNVMH